MFKKVLNIKKKVENQIVSLASSLFYHLIFLFAKIKDFFILHPLAKVTDIAR